MTMQVVFGLAARPYPSLEKWYAVVQHSTTMHLCLCLC